MISLAEAADSLGLKRSTLRHQIRLRVIKATKVGHQWTLDEREVERYRNESLGRRFGRQPEENPDV